MSSEETFHAMDSNQTEFSLTERRDLLKELHALPAGEIVNRILAHDNPRDIVQALAVYAPLDSEDVPTGQTLTASALDSKEAAKSMVPVSPFHHAGPTNMLTEAVRTIIDLRFLERLHLEFAGLCNQILAADGIQVDALDVLAGTSRQAAAYVNPVVAKLPTRWSCGPRSREVPPV